MEENKGLMTIEWITSKDQLADTFTKPLSEELHQKFTLRINGWKMKSETAPKQVKVTHESQG